MIKEKCELSNYSPTNPTTMHHLKITAGSSGVEAAANVDSIFQTEGRNFCNLETRENKRT